MLHASWFALLPAVLASAGCSSPGAGGEPGQPKAACVRQQCAQLPPVPVLHFAVQLPQSAEDYPYGPSDLPAQAPAPGEKLYLSAHGSADPEGEPIGLFWNVQDPQSRYMTLEPAPGDEHVAFTPTDPGAHLITLQVVELGGSRQAAQQRLALEVSPRPCAPDGVAAPCADLLEVPGGTFLIGSDDADAAASERPRHPAEVAPFALDQYETTVGRFRRFLNSYDATSLVEGQGAHPALANSGWQTAWQGKLPTSAEEFAFAISECGGSWTDELGPNEARPISCITWFEAFAFCAWEGKRLPTELEWEFAAAGGDEQRLFPWGNEPPSRERAVFGCLFDGNPTCTDADLPVTGSLLAGGGRFGQLDLAGSLWEWTLDSFLPYADEPCVNCASLGADDTSRVFRGGDFKFADPASLKSTTRYAFQPAFPDPTRGLRCAR
jgi:formylglycine-generating enzyme